MPEERSEVQNIPLGVVGPREFMPKMEEILKGFPSFRPIMVPYGDSGEAPALVKSMMPDVEVLLFTGPVPYWISKKEQTFSVPAHFVPLTGGGLYRALLRLQRRNRLTCVSVDTLPMKIVERTVSDMDGDPVKFVWAGDALNMESRKLAAFHLDQYRLGKTTGAITALRSVFEELSAAGVPAEWVIPSDEDIVVALERALLSTETRRNKESQVVLGLIRIDDDLYSDPLITEHEVQRMRLELSRNLINFVESLEGDFRNFGGTEHMFVTTRGAFERATGGYKYVPLAWETNMADHFKLSIGVGFGRTAAESGTHARAALRQAIEANGSHCIIIREDGGLIGPLEMIQPHVYQLSLFDPSMLESIESGGMSKSYLSRLAVQAVQKGKTLYLAHELASVLGVTIRTVHRCLLLWTESGLVEIVGEERTAAKGRPRQIYRFKFLADHMAQLASDRVKA